LGVLSRAPRQAVLHGPVKVSTGGRRRSPLPLAGTTLATSGAYALAIDTRCCFIGAVCMGIRTFAQRLASRPSTQEAWRCRSLESTRTRTRLRRLFLTNTVYNLMPGRSPSLAAPSSRSDVVRSQRSMCTVLAVRFQPVPLYEFAVIRNNALRSERPRRGRAGHVAHRDGVAVVEWPAPPTTRADGGWMNLDNAVPR
jgi:hypothetical protein